MSKRAVPFLFILGVEASQTSHEKDAVGIVHLLDSKEIIVDALYYLC